MKLNKALENNKSKYTLKVIKLSKIKKIKLKFLKPVSDIKWSKEQLELKGKIIDSYDPRIGVIVISKDNKILDGNHRYKILFDHYGGEHEIIVKQKRFKLWCYLLNGLLILIVFSPILVPIILRKYIYRKINTNNGLV